MMIYSPTQLLALQRLSLKVQKETQEKHRFGTDPELKQLLATARQSGDESIRIDLQHAEQALAGRR